MGGRRPAGRGRSDHQENLLAAQVVVDFGSRSHRGERARAPCAGVDVVRHDATESAALMRGGGPRCSDCPELRDGRGCWPRSLLWLPPSHFESAEAEMHLTCDAPRARGHCSIARAHAPRLARDMPDATEMDELRRGGRVVDFMSWHAKISARPGSAPRRSSWATR